MSGLRGLILLCLIGFWPSSLHSAIVVTKLGKVPESAITQLKENTARLLLEIEGDTSLAYDGDISLVIAGSNDDFMSYLAGFGSSLRGEFLGVAIAERKSVALNLEYIRRVGTSALSVYKHELFHIVFGTQVNKRLRPLWFEEGAAQWVSETPLGAAFASLGYISGTDTQPTSLSHISAMARDPSLMSSGYHHALGAINDLEKRFGRDTLKAFFGALRDASREPQASADDSTPQEAQPNFITLFNASFPQAFATWQDSFIQIRDRSILLNILGFLGNYWFGLTFLLGTVFLFIAARRKRQREARIVEGWREEEEFLHNDPEWSFDSSPEGEDDELGGQKWPPSTR